MISTTDDIDRRNRVSWRPEFEARQFGIVVKRDHLRDGTNKYIVRDHEGGIHYLASRELTKEA
jgi:hypothetical protein